MTRRAGWSAIGIFSGMACIVAASSAHAVVMGSEGVAEGAAFWIRWAGAVLLCLLLGIAGAYSLRARRAGGAAWPGWRAGAWLAQIRAAPPRRLRVIESLRVGAQLEVSLLEYDDCELLLASSSQGAVLLSERPRKTA